MVQVVIPPGYLPHGKSATRYCVRSKASKPDPKHSSQPERLAKTLSKAKATEVPMPKEANTLIKERVEARVKRARARTAAKMAERVLRLSAMNSVIKELVNTETIADMTTMLKLLVVLHLGR
jgi:uncharacterized membrane protein